MSTPLQQIAIAVVTAGCISFGTITFYAGAQDAQIKSNTKNIESYAEAISKIPTIELSVAFMDRRLDTYEDLVVNGQREILEEITAIRIDSKVQSTKIGAIEVDIKEINDKINN